MHAWRAHAYGPPESLVWEEVADPPLSDGQVRIDVKAASVNFADVLFAAGTYQVKPAPPFVPGFEVAGTIMESRNELVPVGTRVAALLDSGGYATRAVATRATTYTLPEHMSFEEGAALTITYQTAWFALHRRAVIEAGDWVLVHSGAGGVGSAVIQTAKAAAARVIATAGGPEKVAVCKKLGADVVVDYSKEDFVDVVKRTTEGRGANIIIDPVGGDVFDRSTRCIAFEGRIVVVGFASGRIPELKMNYPLVKNYSVLGLHWGLYRQYDPRAIEWAQKELYRLYADGAVKPLISQVLPMSEAPKAMASVAGRGSTGKVVLKP